VHRLASGLARNAAWRATLSEADRRAAAGAGNSCRHRAWGALLDRLIADARSGFKIIPLSPYVKGQPLRHPEWADVLRG
jgi:hypothetical protein